MESLREFKLLELEALLPIHNRNVLLAWLKGKYNIAMQAVISGFQHVIVLEMGDRAVTSEEFLQLIDTREGVISPEFARLLIDLIHSDKLPIGIYADHKSIDPGFYQFALQA